MVNMISQAFIFCSIFMTIIASKITEKGNCKMKMLRIDDTDASYSKNHGQIIEYLRAVSIVQCQDFCLRHQQCVGFNYHFCNDESLKRCDLLGSLGSNESNECVIFKEFDYEKVQKTLLQPCSSDENFFLS